MKKNYFKNLNIGRLMKQIQKIKNKFYFDGYVKVKKLFSKNEIKKILTDVENIKKKFKYLKNPNIHYTEDNKVNTIHDINKFIKKGYITKVSKNPDLKKIIEYILGEKCVVRNIEFFLKPKQTGLKAPYHQDNYYWNIVNKKALNVWIACSPSNSKNGGVGYYLKSHLDGLVKHELSYLPGSSQQIPSNYLRKKKYEKKIPSLVAGDCIIHHCEVIHGSKPNESNFDRVGLVISFKAKSAKVNSKGWAMYQRKLKKNLKFLNKKIKFNNLTKI